MTKHDDLPPLDALNQRIAKAREKSDAKIEKPAPENEKSTAWRSGSELIAGVAVGGFIGYQLDEWLGIRPACTVFGIFLGMAGGVMNIYRAVSHEARQQEESDAARSSNRNIDRN